MESSSWQYDELKQIGTDYNDIREVRDYDERMSKLRDAEKESQLIIKAIGLNKEQTLIDLGTGTGSLAIEASKHCRKVKAVDISQVMLDYARGKAVSKNIKNIEFIQAGFLTFKHDDDPVDAIVTQIALHHLPDFWKQVALKRMYDMLRPGGKLYIKDVVFPVLIDKYESSVNYVINNMKETAGEEMGKSFIRHIREEFSTYDWIMEEMIYRAGFDIESADYQDNFIAVYLCAKSQDVRK